LYLGLAARPGLWNNVQVRLARRSLLIGSALWPLAVRAEDVVEPDFQARWLAGLEPPKAFEASAEWRSYAQTENDRWAASAARIKAMEDWSAKELASLVPADRPVLYPFAGPDALHAIALFGRSKRLFLIGLEGVGQLPDPRQAPAAGFFSRLGTSQAYIHRLGFFRTQEMASDYSKSGVLPSIVGTVVRLGGKITSVRGGRIDYANRAGEARRIDYVSADLANAGLKAQTQLIADIHGLAPYVTFVKAGMYLLGESRFSYLRQTLLDESATIVQDDTGLPLKYFDSKWAMRFYGAYEAPPPAYTDRAEDALKTALEHRSVAALPFGIGYHVQPAKACLTVATAARGDK
jgi:hypothetical protein